MCFYITVCITFSNKVVGLISVVGSYEVLPNQLIQQNELLQYWYYFNFDMTLLVFGSTSAINWKLLLKIPVCGLDSIFQTINSFVFISNNLLIM